MRHVLLLVVVLGLQGIRLDGRAALPESSGVERAAGPALQDAQRLFYNGQYEAAAAATLALCTSRLDDLAACELRTTSLLFQIKAALGESGSPDKAAAWKQCAACPGLNATFVADTAKALAVARARMQAQPEDMDTLFLLGKLDLNFVWLELGTLGRKTGWDEYWEARRSLDRVLRATPDHVRARVARAWIDYIVGTKVPLGVRWILGGGNRRRGLVTVRQVVDQGRGDFFARTEAMFALWDMQVRERELPAAVTTARLIARDFPENGEIRRFLAARESEAPTVGQPPTP